MNLLKVKILKSIKSIQIGYGPTGSAKHRVQAVHDFIVDKTSKKSEQEAWTELFTVLCLTNPQAVTGGGWQSELINLAKEVSDVAPEMPKGGMTLAQISELTQETEEEEIDNPSVSAHAAVIAGANADLPAPTESQDAVTNADEEEATTSDAHAAVIASSNGGDALVQADADLDSSEEEATEENTAPNQPQTSADVARDMIASAE